MPQRICFFYPTRSTYAALFFVWIGVLGGIRPCAYGQNIESIRYSARTLIGRTEDGERYRLLRGAVRLMHKKMEMTCDSARFYEKRQYCIALGHVVMSDSSGVLYANRLNYDGLSRQAELRGEVRYEGPLGVLQTQSLDYDLKERRASFFGGGTMQDSTETLTSQRGTYERNGKIGHFTGDVLATSPSYDLRCDTLHRDSQLRLLRLGGHTQLRLEDSVEVESLAGGFFYSAEKRFLFYHARASQKGRTMYGDTLVIDDDEKQSLHSQGHAWLSLGDSLSFWGTQSLLTAEHLYVYGQALTQRILPKDTFYLAADTLVIHMQEKKESLSQDSVKEDSASNTTLELLDWRAWGDSRFVKNKVLAYADTLRYEQADSVLHFKGELPLLWFDDIQASADSIQALLPQLQLQKIYLSGNAFSVMQDSLGLFNQLSSHDMRFFFQEDTLAYIDVLANTQSIYHLLEGDSALMGMNHVLSGEARLYFVSQKLDQVRFLFGPTGTFYPPSEITATNNRLDGFLWHPEKRPSHKRLQEKTTENKGYWQGLGFR